MPIAACISPKAARRENENTFDERSQERVEQADQHLAERRAAAAGLEAQPDGEARSRATAPQREPDRASGRRARRRPTAASAAGEQQQRGPGRPTRLVSAETAPRPRASG